ncbi:unnamed protein product, partial [Ectocarpus sp. 12 AP-2014]
PLDKSRKKPSIVEFGSHKLSFKTRTLVVTVAHKNCETSTECLRSLFSTLFFRGQGRIRARHVHNKSPELVAQTEREKNICGTQFADWSTHLRRNFKNGKKKKRGTTQDPWTRGAVIHGGIEDVGKSCRLRMMNSCHHHPG